MSTAAMTRISSVLQRLDVRDDLVDLLVGDLAPERRHRRREAGHDLGLGVEDRLADVVLVHLHVALVRRLLLAPEPLPRRADQTGAGRRVAADARLLGVDLLPLRGED